MCRTNCVCVCVGVLKPPTCHLRLPLLHPHPHSLLVHMHSSFHPPSTLVHKHERALHPTTKAAHITLITCSLVHPVHGRFCRRQLRFHIAAAHSHKHCVCLLANFVCLVLFCLCRGVLALCAGARIAFVCLRHDGGRTKSFFFSVSRELRDVISSPSPCTLLTHSLTHSHAAHTHTHTHSSRSTLSLSYPSPLLSLPLRPTGFCV